jgi:hypothetical protein
MTERDNESRLGIIENPPLEIKGTTNSVPEVDNNKAGLDYVMPKEMVDLPSQGKFYPEGHPLHKITTVEIKYMTAKEEDILTSKTLLKKGIAIDKMLESLIVDKRIKLDDLILGDKNALILAARKTGYGPSYETSVVCPKCENKVKFNFNLDEIENKKMQVVDGVTETTTGTFLVILPKMKIEVEIRPITGKDEKALSEIQDQKKEQSEKATTSQMKMFVVAVNGDKNKRVIGNVVENMPASDARFLREAYKKLVPEVDMTQIFSCTSCDFEEAIEVPLTSEFFWPRG